MFKFSGLLVFGFIGFLFLGFQVVRFMTLKPSNLLTLTTPQLIAKVHNSFEITKLLWFFYEKITKKIFLNCDT